MKLAEHRCLPPLPRHSWTWLKHNVRIDMQFSRTWGNAAQIAGEPSNYFGGLPGNNQIDLIYLYSSRALV
jgi:hypothetical protein